MGRPKGGKNRKYTYEFKLKAVETYLNEHRSFRSVAAELYIAETRVRAWVKLYNEGLLETGRKRPGNPFSALHTSKSLSKEERLELENLKLRIENERLKKGYLVKGGGVNKEYVTISDANTKSSKS
ncbi:MAG: transposase [Aeriscardovia sp.]|nr:transposase [Aeriscardovia sp.]